jgi:hypothetical protein
MIANSKAFLNIEEQTIIEHYKMNTFTYEIQSLSDNTVSQRDLQKRDRTKLDQ